MRGKFSSRSSESEAPRPFSSEWLAADAPVHPAPEPFRLPDWIPDGRALSAALVVIVSIATAIVTVRGGQGIAIQNPASITLEAVATVEAPNAVSEPEPAPRPTPTAAAAIGETVDAEPTAAIVQQEAPAVAEPPHATMEFARAPSVATEPETLLAVPPAEGALLPNYRIVTFYGHPHDPNMGIVGEMSIEQLAESLRAEAANYAAADPSRPVIPAFELIATVAQRVPGADGTYILDTDHDTLKTYIDYAEEQGMLVVLDLQIGRGTVADEIEKVRDLLARPNVHLALDPEFAVAEGEIPGEYIGSIPAESVVYAQQVLAEISRANGIPPKLLIVHQFREDMIQGKETLGPMPNVQLVIDADGYGAPELKTAVYNFLVRDEPVEFAGVKIFYRQDVPLMTPQEVLALVPTPDVIIYQ